MSPFSIALALLVLLMGLPLSAASPAPARRPNVVLILTDDQGYGDVGLHGNEILRTPNLDRLGRESVRMDRFYVSPVCAPTRASLLTGRYSYRGGVVDTYIGRALMRPEEVTLAEVLSKEGYRTGIFGKWHLGDNAPMRPEDQGFQQSFIHHGGGLAQPADPPRGNSYFDPILWRNGSQVPTKGHCTDLFTDAAIEFVNENRAQPFFLYLAYNAPHDPLIESESEVAPYRSSLGAAGLTNQLESTARVYGMISRIDRNVGRLLDQMQRLGLDENTLVIFTTDNGPAGPRFNAGLRDRKGTVYEGGIRVPFFARWKGRWLPKTVPQRAAHIDVMPTILEAVNLRKPRGPAWDGRSFLPLLRGRGRWQEQDYAVQWHRGDVPEQDRAFAFFSGDYKLVQSKGVSPNQSFDPLAVELYQLRDDPFEKQNLASAQPAIVARLRSRYHQWFSEVSERGFEPTPIEVGGRENPILLTRQDWRGPAAGWGPQNSGHWQVEGAEGNYTALIHAPVGAPASEAKVELRWNGAVLSSGSVPAGAILHRVQSLQLPGGTGALSAVWITDNREAGAGWLELQRLK